MSLNAQQPPQSQAPQPERAVAAPMVDEKYGTAEQIMALPPAKLVEILRDPKASIYAKAKACQRLAVSGDHSAVPALAALLTDPQLSHYARYALEPMPDPAAAEALRAALGKVKGRLLVGVINSLGQRRDAQSVEALGKLLDDPDREVAEAASAALARIRPPL